MTFLEVFAYFLFMAAGAAIGWVLAHHNAKIDHMLLDEENRNLRADLTLAQLRASALENRIERMKGGNHE